MAKPTKFFVFLLCAFLFLRSPIALAEEGKPNFWVRCGVVLFFLAQPIHTFLGNGEKARVEQENTLRVRAFRRHPGTINVFVEKNPLTRSVLKEVFYDASLALALETPYSENGKLFDVIFHFLELSKNHGYRARFEALDIDVRDSANFWRTMRSAARAEEPAFSLQDLRRVEAVAEILSDLILSDFDEQVATGMQPNGDETVQVWVGNALVQAENEENFKRRVGYLQPAPVSDFLTKIEQDKSEAYNSTRWVMGTHLLWRILHETKLSRKDCFAHFGTSGNDFWHLPNAIARCFLKFAKADDRRNKTLEQTEDSFIDSLSP